MFSQLFLHDVFGQGGLSNERFGQRNTNKVNTPYIFPTIDQGKYCSKNGGILGDGLNLFHDEINLEHPFRLFGRDVKKLYIHDLWIGIESPNVFLDFATSAIPLGMPCDCEFVSAPVFTPDPESLGPGNNEVVCMGKNFGELCYPNTFYEGTTFLIEGEVRVQADEDDEVTTTTSDEGIEVQKKRGIGELRRFAAINWTNDSREAEIVFLYGSAQCLPAVGFFYGGPDGLRAADFPGLVVSKLCDLLPKTCLGEDFKVPVAFGAFFVYQNRQALAYTGCRESTESTGSDRADHNLNGRSFWFELDEIGFPNGTGRHNGPLLSRRIGVGDLDFFEA